MTKCILTPEHAARIAAGKRARMQSRENMAVGYR